MNKWSFNLNVDYKEQSLVMDNEGTLFSLHLSIISHVPILAACLARTNGHVLEMGVGYGSTPLIHTMCFNRQIVSADTELKWLELFKPLANSVGRKESHEFHLVTDWNKFLSERKYQYYDVAFVDHDGGSRVDSVDTLRNRAKWIVLHDTDPAQLSAYGYEPIISTFKYRFDWTHFKPWTTVLSMTDEFSL